MTAALASPSASVIICAYTDRRWDVLEASIHAALDQRPPAREIVLVVDHNDALLRRCRLGGIVKDTRLDGNLVIGSGHDGINITSASTTVTRNLAVHNGNLGIEAVAGVLDGGSNRAFANGNPLQCLNIAC